MKPLKNKLKEELRGVQLEAQNKIANYIVTSLGLVAGLAWNDAIKAAIDYFFPANEQSLWAKFSYALFISLVIVFISVYLVKLFKKEEKNIIAKKQKEAN